MIMNKVETWAVTWVHEGQLDKPFASKCVVQQGYSTLADIPKMIAIKRGYDAADIQLTRLELLGVTYQ